MTEIACDAPPGIVRTLSRFAELDGPENRTLRALVGRQQRFPGGRELLREGECGRLAHVVVEGWAFCYKDLSDGRR